MTENKQNVRIDGIEIHIETGARIFGGRHENSYAWKFTSKEGGITHLCLSGPAMQAMIQIFQEICGCD